MTRLAGGPNKSDGPTPTLGLAGGPNKSAQATDKNSATTKTRGRLWGQPPLFDPKSDSEADEDEPLPTRAQTKSDGRNTLRVVERDEVDEHLLSKYLPTNPDDVFCGPIVGPDDYFVPPAWLMDAVREVAGSVALTPRAPPVVFKTDPASLERNAALMKSHDYCLDSLLRTTAGTTMDPSAEFRPVEQLDRIYNGHPNYSFVRTMIVEGMDYVYSYELTEEQRTAKLEANLLRGNHKSAAESNDHLTRLLSRDVTYGFAMPLPTQIIARMKGAMVQPAGLIINNKCLLIYRG
jgi:hypothetical protein